MTKAPFPTIATADRIKHGRTPTQFRVRGLSNPTHHPAAITVTGRDQGQADAAKRHALTKGCI